MVNLSFSHLTFTTADVWLRGYVWIIMEVVLGGIGMRREKGRRRGNRGEVNFFLCYCYSGMAVSAVVSSLPSQT